MIFEMKKQKRIKKKIPLQNSSPLFRLLGRWQPPPPLPLLLPPGARLVPDTHFTFTNSQMRTKGRQPTSTILYFYLFIFTKISAGPVPWPTCAVWLATTSPSYKAACTVRYGTINTSAVKKNNKKIKAADRYRPSPRTSVYIHTMHTSYRSNIYIHMCRALKPRGIYTYI